MSTLKQQPLSEAMYYILLSAFKPLHGYGIKKKIEEITRGSAKLSSSTLYGALKNLLGRELIMVTNDIDGKKEYIITEKGKTAVMEEIKRLKSLISDAERQNKNQ